MIPVRIIQFFAVLSLHSNVNSSYTSIVFLILNRWETDLQKSIDFLLNPFFVFRYVCEVIVLYVHMLLYKNEIKV